MVWSAPVFQLRLEADHVEKGAERIVLAQLDDGVGLFIGIARIGQANRLHRSVAQGSRPRSAITSIGRQPSK